MINDYKSALDKVNPTEEKKAEIKQLFKNRKMRKGSFIKPTVAITVCAALVIGGVKLKNEMGVKEYGYLSANRFSIEINAQTLNNKNEVAISSDMGFAGGMSEGDDNDVSYTVEFPVKCSGENIKNVTYSIQGGIFNISSKKSERVIVKGTKVENRIKTPWTLVQGADLMEQYTSFTVNYDKQTSDKTTIMIGNNSSQLSGSQREKIIDMRTFIGAENKKEKEIYDNFYKNLVIKCTVTYKDKSTESKEIRVSARLGKMSEIDSDIEGKKDKNTLYTVFKMQGSIE